MSLFLFAAGFVGADLLGVYLPWNGWQFPAGLAALACAGVLLGLRRGKYPARALLGAGIALLWLLGYGALFHGPAQMLDGRTVQLEAVVTGWPEAGRYGLTIPVKAGEVGETRGNATLYVVGEALAQAKPGNRISCIAYCTATTPASGSLYDSSKGILFTARAYGKVTLTPDTSGAYLPARLAGVLRGYIDRLYPPGQAGFLRALLTGDRSGLDDSTTHNLNRAGISHVVVISGLHVTFLAGLLTALFPLRRRGSFWLLVGVLFFFAAMTGSAPGTVRAAILCTMTMGATRLRRQSHPLTGLSVALLALLLWNPWAVANAGLQFSFLSTAGIFCVAQPLCHRSAAWMRTRFPHLPGWGKRLLHSLVGVVCISLGTMLFTVPLSALYFRQFSLLAPLTNLLTYWSVFLAFVGGLCSLVAGMLWLPLGQLLAGAVGIPVDFFLGAGRWASRLPLAALTMDSVYYQLWAVFVYGLLALYFFWRGKGKRPILPLCAGTVTLCLAVICTGLTSRTGEMTLSVLDVGQGQSVVLTSGPYRALVDCGGNAKAGDVAATALQSSGDGTLDLLILTHFHKDHAGGVPELFQRLHIQTLALPDIDAESDLRREIEALAAEQGTEIWWVRGDSQVAFGEGTLQLFAPVGAGEKNEACLSVLSSTGSWDALMTGDMNSETENRLLETENLPDLEVLVVGHHGSQYSTGEKLLTVGKPEIAMISVGYNTYGHPAPETLERLTQHHCTVYRTDQVGAVTVTSQEKTAWHKRNRITEPTAN